MCSFTFASDESTVLAELRDIPYQTAIPDPPFSNFEPIDSATDTVNESDEDDVLDSFATSSFQQITLENVTSVIDKLVQLSFKLRSSATRLGFSLARDYEEIDPETGVDLFKEFKSADQRHVTEFFANCRRSRGVSSGYPSDNFLVQRLARANTARRQQFRKWRHHRLKLEIIEKPKPNVQADITQALRSIDLGHPAGADAARDYARSIPTTATQTPNTAPNFDDTASHVSVSTQAPFRDPTASEIVFPSLPERLTFQKEFECPYCCILCSKSCSTGTRWRYVEKT